MDNHHDIDKLFRDRFDGLKDHSVDPASQWEAFEKATDLATASSTGVSTSAFWSMAASFTAVIAVSSLATMDSNKSAGELSATVLNSTSQILTQPLLKESAVYDGFIAAQAEDFQSSRAELNADGTPSSLDAVADLDNLDFDFYKPSESHAIGLDQEESFDNRCALMPMDPLVLEVASPNGIVNRAELDAESIAHTKAQDNALYVRGGIRYGRGESNSVNNPALWRANTILGLGYVMNLGTKTSLSIEVGHLRRSGNGIERSKDVDFTPLIAVLSSAYSKAEQDRLARELQHIRESLIATTLDYVHLPVQLHVQWSKRSNVSIGAYADYLVRAKNESYMVYSGKDYIPASFGENDELSKEGLNTLRYGVLAGFEQQISTNLSANIRGLIPVTSIYNRESDYSIHQEPSQLVDLQLTLTYRI